MADKGKMPPELLAHFKSKAEDNSGSKEEQEESNKVKRKEAVKKARTRLEAKNRKPSNDQEKEAG